MILLYKFKTLPPLLDLSNLLFLGHPITMSDLKGLVEGVDYYFNERHRLVWTEAYLEKKGRCCYSGCLHCPYDKKLKNKKVDPEIPQELQLDSSRKKSDLTDEELASLADQYTKDL